MKLGDRVTIRRITGKKDNALVSSLGDPVFHGVITQPFEVGKTLWVENLSHWFHTSTVKAILPLKSNPEAVHVKTLNSTYRVQLVVGPAKEAPPVPLLHQLAVLESLKKKYSTGRNR